MKRFLSIAAIILASILLWVVPVCGDSFTVYVNGTVAEFENTPIVYSGKVYMELKELFGLLGRTTTWNSQENVFYGSLGHTNLVYDPAGNVLKLGEKDVYHFKRPPLKINGHIYVCAEEFAEHLNFRVELTKTNIELYGDLVPSAGSASFPHYEINAVFSGGTISGNEKVRLVNVKNRAVQDLLFVLPAASINPQSKINIHKVTIGGQTVEFQTDDTYLRVILPETLEPSRRCDLEISFDTPVPKGPSRLGYTDSCAVLSCWYPVVSLDESVPVYTNFGEPYSFQSGTYSVDLRVDKGRQVFSGLEQVGKEDREEDTCYKFSSSLPIREAVFVVGRFSTATSSSGNTKVCYAYKNYRPEVIKYASKALEMFGRWWGSYPYPSFTLVEVPLEQLHGMEYGGLILLSSINEYDPFIIVHEVAHQWWQGMVGNNQETEAWIDEGLANYSALLFFEDTLGPEAYNARVKSMETQAEGGNFGKLRSSLLDFSNKKEYRNNAYIRGALLWHKVRQREGRDQIIGFLRNIQEHYRFDQITTDEIIFLLDNAFPEIQGVW